MERTILARWLEKFDGFEDRHDSADGGWQSQDLEDLVRETKALLNNVTPK